MCELPTMTSNSDLGAQIECKLGDDPRLIAGAAAIVAHIAGRAGLPEDFAHDISAAASEACTQTLLACRKREGRPSGIRFAAANLAGRIEVTVERSPEPPEPSGGAERAEQLSGCADEIRHSLKGAAVDQVNLEMGESGPRVTLVKRFEAAKRRSVF
jgi:hypothetical protein